ncbi:hypothetical protein ACFFX1_41375 [Dactylosporangium sucinum]|uniref:Uncharacterized protein n=1 Tax=Dactylosporangium sucinum TaxID=1424081 RepID=A0A917UG09_9ACTN|nr:hypothetical protein [Dactylosporangium sucinum]GGM90284.1 hypothetical protein GCM10007977_110390 [Dactylosporangium sucinum]
MSEDRETYGPVVGDIWVRDMRAKVRLTVTDDLELILGDGDTAVTLTMSWTSELELAADKIEEVGNELHAFAVLLRERAERRKRPLPASRHPEMGILPTQ